MERTYEAPSNEAPHMILGYHWGRSVTYLHFSISQSMACGQATNRKTEQRVRASVHFRFHFYTIDGYFDAGH